MEPEAAAPLMPPILATAEAAAGAPLAPLGGWCALGRVRQPIAVRECGGYTDCGRMELVYYSVQVVHFSATLAYMGLGFAGYNFLPAGLSLQPGLGALALALAVSALRGASGQVGCMALLGNYHYLAALGARAQMRLGFIGQVDPGIDLACLSQIFAYLSLMLAAGAGLAALPPLAALLVALGDYASVRVRFVQGHAAFKEGWKPCPILRADGSVEVLERQEGKLYALSYRWREANKDGFSEENTARLQGLVREERLAGGFVDKRCVWRDGSMATLDVNKSIYTAADAHLIYASRQEFEHFKLRMRWKFFLFLPLSAVWLCASLVHAARYSAADAAVHAVASALMVLVWTNHVVAYVTWGIQNMLPGLQRVWLRLEYECRRDNAAPSTLFCTEGVFQHVSFQSSWHAGVTGMWWLLTQRGVPVCLLPATADMSRLESRSWAETVALVDHWVGYSPPCGRAARERVSSLVLVLRDSSAADGEGKGAAGGGGGAHGGSHGGRRGGLLVAGARLQV